MPFLSHLDFNLHVVAELLNDVNERMRERLRTAKCSSQASAGALRFGSVSLRTSLTPATIASPNLVEGCPIFVLLSMV